MAATTLQPLRQTESCTRGDRVLMGDWVTETRPTSQSLNWLVSPKGIKRSKLEFCSAYLVVHVPLEFTYLSTCSLLTDHSCIKTIPFVYCCIGS